MQGTLQVRPCMPPAPPLTVFCAHPTTEKKKEKQKRVARCARSVSTKVDTYQQPPASCRRRGTVGLRGVSRMDAATKPPGMDSRRPRKPTVPRHPTDSPLLLLLQLLRLRVQGCKPCR